MKKWVSYILIVVLGLLFAVIGLFNSENVTVNYVLGEKTLPLFVVMLVSFLFGALLCLLIFGFKSLYWRSRARSIERQLRKNHNTSTQYKI